MKKFKEYINEQSTQKAIIKKEFLGSDEYKGYTREFKTLYKQLVNDKIENEITKKNPSSSVVKLGTTSIKHLLDDKFLEFK